ncbi:hypothetical protein U7230_03470 [Carboxydochorda subterranea]|uniref:Uncharacterized protein n=1 Tax=Carboxydichorda subterranea TaxID=3109565 RepID=A0ABZ1BZP8_9FIRM|nr:hypothetical protein [Limnochorda sp. L945t]WRP18078.1 hypothetical protein U7230_03470 [Limnochorda sp. L945t]
MRCSPNTVTVGEPPQDIGSLLEFFSGGLAFLVAVGLAFRFGRKFGFGRTSRWVPVLTGLAAVLAVGVLWWFTHPIDQSQPGAPGCIPGNVLYNLFHQPCP